ncbi:hypothetical protein DFH06DRAFT_1143164 [Mycena polygramma]|nr:hypothetical protein DFH06DRAFT_1143164 [Mycena polygramma]
MVNETKRDPGRSLNRSDEHRLRPLNHRPERALLPVLTAGETRLRAPQRCGNTQQVALAVQPQREQDINAGIRKGGGDNLTSTSEPPILSDLPVGVIVQALRTACRASGDRVQVAACPPPVLPVSRPQFLQRHRIAEAVTTTHFSLSTTASTLEMISFTSASSVGQPLCDAMALEGSITRPILETAEAVGGPSPPPSSTYAHIEAEELRRGRRQAQLETA